MSLSVLAEGGSYDISLLGCLTTGSGCPFGNQLNANFSIPMAGLNEQGVAAQVIAGLVPSLDLFEDDGITEIQGSITNYSYQRSSEVPEPTEFLPLCAAMTALLTARRRSRQV